MDDADLEVERDAEPETDDLDREEVLPEPVPGENDHADTEIGSPKPRRGRAISVFGKGNEDKTENEKPAKIVKGMGRRRRRRVKAALAAQKGQ